MRARPRRARPPHPASRANPRRRAEEFPDFDFEGLHAVAQNLAIAFDGMHARGYVVGDVSDSNVLVDERGICTLVDTDSFQVPRQDGHGVYRCCVGRPEFTPPELQNVQLADVDRNQAHDLFGLGVLGLRPRRLVRRRERPDRERHDQQ